MNLNDLPKTKDEAKQKGINKFFTGIPCKNGHISFRYIRGNCSKCVNENTKKRREEKPEVWRAYDSKYRKEKPEKIKESRKKHYHNNSEYYRNLASKYRKNNPEKVSDARKRSYQKHADKRRSEAREWSKENTEERNAQRRNHYKRNRSKIRTYNDDRKMAKLSRIPIYWSEIDDFIHSECVNLCAERRATTNIDWQVDHMIPILAKNASGLHIGCNMQVIPRSLNARKCNRMKYTNNFEWINDTFA